ncbi:hypothetical protein M0805_005706 [Coniferiporia weirii]|nr:hypothetical protein M0805_005706 [Coniferiporia weirii]
MFEPIRGGTRGGQAEFKWSDVSADKDREHYLGHSINAPTGRWQKNKDVHWYNRDLASGEDEKQAEIRRIKEAEEEAMAQALGFAPTKKSIDAAPDTDGTQNEGPKAGPSDDSPAADESNEAKELRKMEKRMRAEEKRAKKAERKARKEAKRLERRRPDTDSDHEREERYRGRDRSRSRSPRRRSSRERVDRSTRHRSHSRTSPPVRTVRGRGDYDLGDTVRERERERRRWGDNARRELPRGDQYR